MDRRIIWTPFAIASRWSIFRYWYNRNKSKTYSKKLNSEFQKALKLVAKHPLSTIASNNENVRLKIVSHFQVVYSITETEIIVLDIWDTRQNPDNFPIK